MVQYIDKFTLVAEIERQKIGYNVDGKHSIEYDATRLCEWLKSLKDRVKPIRGEYGTRRGNDIIRSIAEAKDGCKYSLWGRD